MKDQSELNETLRVKLTQDQFNSLPSGTPVTIVWSGGNGPHNYTVTKTKSGKSDIYGEYGNWIGTPDCTLDKVWLNP